MRTFTIEGMEWRVTPSETLGFLVPHVDNRRPGLNEAWRPEKAPHIRMLANFAAESDARANEYLDTTMKQAKRISELERACEDYQLRILEIERLLTMEQRKEVDCPCGGGPGHGADWCADYLGSDEARGE